jgi:hypothetical protein
MCWSISSATGSQHPFTVARSQIAREPRPKADEANVGRPATGQNSLGAHMHRCLRQQFDPDRPYSGECAQIQRQHTQLQPVVLALDAAPRCRQVFARRVA